MSPTPGAARDPVPRATRRPATLCVHAGTPPDQATGALVPPLVQSTTYAWPDLDTQPANSYARGGNATVQALERRLAALEGGSSAIAFGSGLAALDALLRSVPDGSRVVAGANLYGGTVRLLRHFHVARLTVDFVDTSDGAALEAALRTPAAFVLAETPSNPTLAITDVALAARLAHEAGGLLALDNTFLTPLGLRAFDLGADVVAHSTTKYLDGHNATLGGALVLPAQHDEPAATAPEGPLGPRLRWLRKATGAVLAPFEAWLTLQGCKTLHLRTAAQWAAARRLADAAVRHGGASRVLHPGLPSHPGHAVHRRQAQGDGGLLALDLGTRDAARAFVGSLQLFTLAENLGATESLATHPVSMTHADVPPAIRAALGITEGLVRLSVGVEDPADLEADLLQALDRATRPAADPTGRAIPASRAALEVPA
jgi:cystathionine beta-lyase/cystathionine gamma-synthase